MWNKYDSYSIRVYIRDHQYDRVFKEFKQESEEQRNRLLLSWTGGIGNNVFFDSVEDNTTETM